MPNKNYQDASYYPRPPCAQQPQYMPPMPSTSYTQPPQIYDYYYPSKPQYNPSEWVPDPPIDQIELTPKDLSPNNLDLLLNKDMGWYNKSYVEYPSCAQINFNGENVNKYCSIKNSYDCMQQVDCSFAGETFNVSEVFNFEGLDQQTEASNDESDIVVEESDEEYVERKFSCTVCNIIYSPVGNQFYFLTPEGPLTMSSQKSVYEKLGKLVGTVNKGSYLCGLCLGLVNTIDNLEMKLEELRGDLVSKFEATSGIKVCVKKEKCKHRFSCKVCKKIFSVGKVYKRHLDWHKRLNSFLCDVCGRRFNKLSKFKAHFETHKALRVKVVKIKAFTCKLCEKSFRTVSNLKDHFNFCSNNLPHKCKNCDKAFPTPTKLKNHMRLKHDKKFTSICSICNLGFIKISDYKTHIISHSADKKFTCQKCNKTYKTLSNLKFHLKFHNDKLPFICPICSKGFMRKEYLDSHVNLHSGQRNFSCSSCGKKFVSQKNLDAHLKYHDGNIMKKSCNICGKLVSKGLEDHLRTHTNLKEFECESCEMRFNTKSALFKHKKRKHVDKS